MLLYHLATGVAGNDHPFSARGAGVGPVRSPGTVWCRRLHRDAPSNGKTVSCPRDPKRAKATHRHAPTDSRCVAMEARRYSSIATWPPTNPVGSADVPVNCSRPLNNKRMCRLYEVCSFGNTLSAISIGIGWIGGTSSTAQK